MPFSVNRLLITFQDFITVGRFGNKVKLMRLNLMQAVYSTFGLGWDRVGVRVWRLWLDSVACS